MNYDQLQKIAEKATSGPWNYEAERYSAKCVIGIKPRDDRWIASFQPAFNGEANGVFCSTFNPAQCLQLLEDLRKCIEAMDKTRSRADDYADSYLSRPIRDCLASLEIK